MSSRAVGLIRTVIDMTRRTTYTSLIAAATLLLAACGGSDGDETSDTSSGDSDTSSDAAETPDEAADDNGDAADDADTANDGGDAGAAGGSDCEPTSGSFESVDGAVSTSIGGAAAVSLEGGAAYTVYLAAQDLSPDDIGSFSGPDATADAPVIALPITIFNAEGELQPIEAGVSIPYTPDFGVLTFRVTADLGDEFLGNNVDAEGTVTITNVDGNLCGTVDYSDGEKSLTATFDAPTKDG